MQEMVLPYRLFNDTKISVQARMYGMQKKTKGCEGVYNVTRKNPKVSSPHRDGINCYKEESAWSVLVTRDAAFVSYAMDATSSYQRSGENQMGKEDVKVACPNVVANVAKRSCEVHTLIFNGA